MDDKERNWKSQKIGLRRNSPMNPENLKLPKREDLGENRRRQHEIKTNWSREKIFDATAQ